MLALVAIAALSACSRGGDRCRDERDRAGAARRLAFFEFAPAGDLGMGAACACTTPTGAKGEALTFTRASSGTCLKAGTTSGIANGDMVTCVSNEPRVMPGGDGTGGLGLLVEGARTNGCLRSEEIDNAAWLKVGTGVAAPTVTANFAVAPDGTTTADRVQLTAATAVQASTVDQATLGVATGNHAASCFIKGNGTAGTVDFGFHRGGAWALADCSYVAATWTRCSLVASCNSAGSCQISIGNNGTGAGSSRAAQDILLWGCGFEQGGFASSYIATTSAGVTRALETATFPGVAAVGSAGSGAATAVSSDTVAPGSHGLLHMGAFGAVLCLKAAGPVMAAYDGTAETTRATTWSTQPHRYAASWTGSVMTVFDVTGGTSTAGTFDGTMATTNVCIGSGTGGTACGTAGSHADAVVKQVCLDPSAVRCR